MKLDKVEIALLTFLFLHYAVGVWTAVTNTPYFDDVYTVEDGIIEWYTVDALLMCAAVCGWRFFRLRKVRSPLFLAMLGFLTLLFVFGAMEELSWGQRMLGRESSEFFLENNAQGETNFHNLVVGETKLNRLIFSRLLGFLVISYIIIFPILYAKLSWVKNLASTFAVPVPKLIYIVSYLIVGLSYPLLDAFSTKKGELLEFGGCFLFLLILAFPKNAELYDPEQQPLKDQTGEPVQES
jgi:hypothetical protein